MTPLYLIPPILTQERYARVKVVRIKNRHIVDLIISILSRIEDDITERIIRALKTRHLTSL